MADEVFSFEVKADAASADKVISRMESGLDRVETHAEQVGKALDNAFADNRGRMRDAKGRFLLMGSAAKQTESSVRSLGSVLDEAASKGNALAGALGGKVVDALKRERDMLEQVRGPTREYLANMQALHNLHQKGAISAREYANEVRKLNGSIASHMGLNIKTGGTGKEVVSGGGMSAKLAEALSGSGTAGGSLAGGLLSSPLGKAGAIGAITAAVVGLAQALLGMADTYTKLQNRLRVVASSQTEVTSMFERLQGVAQRTRSDLASTTEGFVRMKLATRELGLSTNDVMQFTERLNKAIKLSGASGAEASGGLLQLSQGLASGRLQGDELRSVMENLPYVADIIAKHMGVTRGELRKMGEEGKISAQTVVDAFNKAGGEIDANFGKTAPTMEESWQMFKDKAMVAIGKVVSESGMLEKLADILEGLAESIKFLTDLIGGLSGKFKELGISAEKTDDNVGGFVDRSITRLKTQGAIPAMFNTVKDGIETLKKAQGETESVHETFLRQLEIIEKVNQAWLKNAQIARTAAAAQRAGVTGMDFDLDFANKWVELKITMAQIGVIMPEVFTATQVKAISLHQKVEEIRKSKMAEQMAEEAKKLFNQLNNVNEVLEGQSKRWKNSVDKVAELQDAMGRLVADKAFLAMRMLASGNFNSQAVALTKDDIDTARALRDAQLEVSVGNNRYADTVLEARKKTNDFKDSLEDLKGAYKSGMITTKEYAEGLKSLGIEESRLEKLYKAIKEPQINFSKDMAALNELFARGRITLTEYNTKMHELLDAFGSKEMRDLLDFATGKTKPNVQVPIGPQGPIAGGVFDDALESHGDRGTMDRVKALNEFEDAVRKVEVELERMEAAQPNLEEDLKHHNAVNAEFARRVALTKAWNEELRRARMNDQDAQFVAGIKNGLNEIKSSIDIAAQSQKILTEGFRGATDALVDMVLAGEDGFKSLEASGKKMVQTLLAEMTRLLIFRALASVFGAPAVGPTIPGFAGGGKMIVGGSGGTDSQLVAFRASPGETVTTTRPGQGGQAAGASEGGRAVAPVVKVFNIQDPDQVPAAMDSRRGQRLILNTMQQSRRTVRGTVTRK